MMRLDPAIAIWVMAPLLVLVMLVTYARIYAMRILQPAAESGIDKTGLQQRNVLARANRLRAFGGLISQAGWKMRRDWLIAPDTGKLLDKNVADANPMETMGSGAGTMDMLKGQMFNMGAQMGVGVLVGSFFTGFIALRLPFSLAERFRGLTQQGIGVPALDTSFVSTSSWFFTAQFGLQGLIRLFSSTSTTADEARMAQMQMGMPQAGPQGFMAKQLYTAEAKAQEIAVWEPTTLLQAERGLLEEACALGLAKRPLCLPPLDLNTDGKNTDGKKKD